MEVQNEWCYGREACWTCSEPPVLCLYHHPLGSDFDFPGFYSTFECPSFFETHGTLQLLMGVSVIRRHPKPMGSLRVDRTLARWVEGVDPRVAGGATYVGTYFR